MSPADNAELDTAVAAGVSNWVNTANLNYIITTAVTDMSNVFRGTLEAVNMFNGDISGWDVSKVTTMHYMFYGATVFNGDISGWNVSKVTDMRNMFNQADIFNQDLENWKDHWSTAAGTLNAAGKYTRNKTNMFVDSGLDANPAVGDDSGDQPNYPSWY